MGLVTRGPDPKDRRKVWLTLTGGGKAYVRRRYKSLQSALSELLKRLPEGEALRFNDSLGAVVSTMKKL
jgi:DNA-binding MarR family transcriptional regulator